MAAGRISHEVIAWEDAEEVLGGLELDQMSLGSVYEAACSRWERRVDQRILKALPSALGGYEVVTSLDFSGAYVGTVGFAPLLPIVLCCERLESLSVAGLGLRPPDISQLLEAVTHHPSLQQLDLSRNEIGTTVAKDALKCAQHNPMLTSITADDALVIPALKNKIRAQTEANRLRQATLPLRSFRYIKTRPSGEAVSQAILEDELARRCEREAAKKAIREQIPYWMPAALQELSETLDVHKHHIGDVFTMFEGGTSTSAEFAKVMKTLDCRFAAAAPQGSDEDRPFTLARYLHCLSPPPADPEKAPLHNRNGIHRIDHQKLFCILRTHVVVPVGESVEPRIPRHVLQAVCNHLYDSREVLLDTLSMLDVKQCGAVMLEELLTGILSLSIVSPSGELAVRCKEDVLLQLLVATSLIPSDLPLRRVTDKSSPEDMCREGASPSDPSSDFATAKSITPVEYRKLFEALQPGDAPTVQWDKMTASSLQMLSDRLQDTEPV